MLDDLILWENIVFEEIEDGKLLSCTWLSSLLKISINNKMIYIMDNHNHALYFRYEALHDGLIQKWATLLHVDQHADMNEPDERISETQQNDLEYIAEYVTEKTQIASFIWPALNAGLIDECVQIRSEAKLEEMVVKDWWDNVILDIDIDFFVWEKDYGHKMHLLRQMIEKAHVVTIATSPYFIDQQEAVSLIKELLS